MKPLHTALLMIIMLPAAALAATPLRVSWGSHNPPPYALTESGQLTGGIIHDIGKALGQQLELPVTFVEVPRARYEDQLQAGTIDLVCITHPDWVRAPAELAWSPPLFSESDIIIQAAGTPVWSRLEHFEGKRLGTILGFRYPALEALFQQQKVLRDDAASLDSNMQRLLLGRIDGVLDANIPAYYWLLQHNQLGNLPVSTFVVSRHDVHCAISRKVTGGQQRIVTAFQRMVADGTLSAVVNRYLRPD